MISDEKELCIKESHQTIAQVDSICAKNQESILFFKSKQELNHDHNFSSNTNEKQLSNSDCPLLDEISFEENYLDFDQFWTDEKQKLLITSINQSGTNWKKISLTFNNVPIFCLEAEWNCLKNNFNSDEARLKIFKSSFPNYQGISLSDLNLQEIQLIISLLKINKPFHIISHHCPWRTDDELQKIIHKHLHYEISMCFETNFTPYEIHLLISLYEDDQNNINLIKQYLSRRSNDEIQSVITQLFQDADHQFNWDDQSTFQLINHVHDNGPEDWEKISKLIKRTPKECAEKWQAIKKDSYEEWTTQEDRQLLQLRPIYRNSWSRYPQSLTHSAQSVKDRILFLESNWTFQKDWKLYHYINKYGFDWDKIGGLIGTNPISCRKHWEDLSLRINDTEPLSLQERSLLSHVSQEDSLIAATFPTRSINYVKSRIASWTKSKDNLLEEAAIRNGGNWEAISSELGKSVSECKDRWSILHPDFMPTNWTPKEEQTLQAAYEVIQQNWEGYFSFLPNKNPSEVKIKAQIDHLKTHSTFSPLALQLFNKQDDPLHCHETPKIKCNTIKKEISKIEKHEWAPSELQLLESIYHKFGDDCISFASSILVNHSVDEIAEAVNNVLWCKAEFKQYEEHQWTTEEENLLISYVEEQGKNYKEISEIMNMRVEELFQKYHDLKPEADFENIALLQ